MKKYLILFIAVLAVLSVGCGRNVVEERGKKVESSIAVILEEGWQENNDILEALKEGKENYSIEYKVIYLKDISEEKNIIDEGYDYILGAGYKATEKIKKLKLEYPKQKFVVMDRILEGENVSSVVISEKEGAYLLGVVAGAMTNGKVGFIGGKDIEIINNEEEGFREGIKSQRGNDQVEVLYLQESNDINGAYDAIKTMRESGILVVTSRVYQGALGIYTYAEESINRGNPIFILGDKIEDAKYKGKFKGINICDFEKDYGIAMSHVIKKISNGELESGRIIQCGIKEDAVRIPNSDLEKMSDSVKEVLQKEIEKIKKH